MVWIIEFIALVDPMVIAAIVFSLIKYRMEDSRLGRFLAVIAFIVSFIAYCALLMVSSELDSFVVGFIIWGGPLLLLILILFASYVAGGKK